MSALVERIEAKLGENQGWSWQQQPIIDLLREALQVLKEHEEREARPYVCQSKAIIGSVVRWVDVNVNFRGRVFYIQHSGPIKFLLCSVDGNPNVFVITEDRVVIEQPTE